MSAAPSPKAISPAEPWPALLDLDQTAAFLGFSRSTLKRLARSGKLGPMPIVLSSRLRRYVRSELEDWARELCPPRREWAAKKAGGQ
jgi:predicted DNA-binding transcriptional regulator AlpA